MAHGKNILQKENVQKRKAKQVETDSVYNIQLTLLQSIMTDFKNAAL